MTKDFKLLLNWNVSDFQYLDDRPPTTIIDSIN